MVIAIPVIRNPPPTVLTDSYTYEFYSQPFHI